MEHTFSLPLFLHSVLQDGPRLSEQANVTDTRKEMSALMSFPYAHDRSNKHFILSGDVFDCAIFHSLRCCEIGHVTR